MEKAFPSLWLLDRYLRDFPKSLHVKIIGVKGGIENWPPRKQLWKHFLSLTLQPSWVRAIRKISKQNKQSLFTIDKPGTSSSSCSPFRPLYLCISAITVPCDRRARVWLGGVSFPNLGHSKGSEALQRLSFYLTFLLRSFGKLVVLCLSFLSVKGNNVPTMEHCWD